MLEALELRPNMDFPFGIPLTRIFRTQKIPPNPCLKVSILPGIGAPYKRQLNHSPSITHQDPRGDLLATRK
jgi:hypothetical protein